MSAALLRTVVVAALLGHGATALAYPYELVAKYSLTGSAAAAEVKVPAGEPLGETTVIPADPTNGRFTGIYLRPKKDQLARSELSRLENLVVRVCAETPCDRPVLPQVAISGAQLLSGEDQLVYPPRPGAPGQAFTTLAVNVYPKYSSDYLCDEERRLRQAEGKPMVVTRLDRKAGEAEKGAVAAGVNRRYLKPWRAEPYSGYAHAVLFEQGLQTAGDGEPILFSFCKGVHDQIDWSAAARAQVEKPTIEEVDAVHARQKRLLADKVVARIKRDTGENVIQARFQGEERDNVYSQFTHQVSLLQDTSDLYLADGRTPIDEHDRVVDKASSLTLAVRESSRFCSGLVACSAQIGKLFVAHVSHLDRKAAAAGAKETRVEKDVALEPTENSWTIKEDLSQHIGDDLTVTVFYVSGDARLRLFSGTARVRNLGLITTFPIVTEVVAAVTKDAANPKDLTTQSTIPISWAINLSHGEASHVAVTFPWMIGVNTRQYPNLAEHIKVFPAVSLIFPLATDTEVKTARVALGGGIALANAFTFSVATTVSGRPQAFFLVGLSAPDLAKAFMK